MIRNLPSQSIGAQMIDASTGAAFVGAVTVYVTIDAGTQALGTVGSGICVSEGNGYFTYVPSAAETNGTLVAFTFIGTGAVPVTIQIATVTAAQQAALSAVDTSSTTISSSVSPIVTFNKDPLAILDYTIDWKRWLGNDTISTMAWVVSAGIGNVGAMFSGTTATVWLGGGTAGVAYYAYNLIATVAGRTEKRTIKINVVNR